MDRLRNYDVEFAGLKNGRHEFSFEVGEAFFKLFDTEQEFSHPEITANVTLDKHSTFLELDIATEGTVQLVCDISNEAFRHPINNDIRVLVKFGEAYDDSDEDVVTIPAADHAFNVAQLIYEDVVLSVPMKKLSPNLSEEDLEILDRYSPAAEPETQDESPEEPETDPRWEALKKLKDKN